MSGIFYFILPSPPLDYYQITYIASDFQHFPIWINLHSERGCELNCYKRLRCSANLLLCSFKHEMLFPLRKLSENFLHLEISLIAQLIYQMQKKTYTNKSIHSNITHDNLAAVGGSIIVWPTVRCCVLQGDFSLRTTQVLQECRGQRKSQKEQGETQRTQEHTPNWCNQNSQLRAELHLTVQSEKKVGLTPLLNLLNAMRVTSASTLHFTCHLVDSYTWEWIWNPPLFSAVLFVFNFLLYQVPTDIKFHFLSRRVI